MGDSSFDYGPPPSLQPPNSFDLTLPDGAMVTVAGPSADHIDAFLTHLYGRGAPYLDGRQVGHDLHRWARTNRAAVEDGARRYGVTINGDWHGGGGPGFGEASDSDQPAPADTNRRDRDRSGGDPAAAAPGAGDETTSDDTTVERTERLAREAEDGARDADRDDGGRNRTGDSREGGRRTQGAATGRGAGSGIPTVEPAHIDPQQAAIDAQMAGEVAPDPAAQADPDGAGSPPYGMAYGDDGTDMQTPGGVPEWMGGGGTAMPMPMGMPFAPRGRFGRRDPLWLGGGMPFPGPMMGPPGGPMPSMPGGFSGAQPAPAPQQQQQPSRSAQTGGVGGLAGLPMPPRPQHPLAGVLADGTLESYIQQLSAMGAIGSGEVRQRATRALRQISGLINQSNKDYAGEIKQWDTEHKEIMKISSDQAKDIEAVWANPKMSFAEKQLETQLLSVERRDEALMSFSHDPQQIEQLMTQRVEIAQRLGQLKSQVDQRAGSGLLSDQTIDGMVDQILAGSKRSDILQHLKQEDASRVENRLYEVMRERNIDPAEFQRRQAAGDMDPTDSGIARAIANYQQPALTTFGSRSPQHRAIMEEVYRINPDYKVNGYKVMADFSGSGKHADTMRSMNVAIDHMDALDQLSSAMKSGNYRLINQAKALFKIQTGSAAPTNLQEAAAFVGSEVQKALAASTQAERLEAASHFGNVGNSPEQATGATATARRLLAGQLDGLRRQYKNGTGLDNFDDLLDPRTVQVLDATRNRRPGTPAQPPSAPAAPATPSAPPPIPDYDTWRKQYESR